MAVGGNVRLRFGDYEFDSQSGTLFRDGSPVKIQPQPLRVLGLLLERPGEIVTREQLRERVWGGATFVEFDQGLNFCIRQIRLALREGASKPRYIETLPKQGYRFIAPVEGLATPAPVPVAAPITPVAVRRRGWWWPAGAGLLVVVAGCALWLLNWPGQVTATVPVPVPFTTYPGFQMSPSFSPEGDRVAFSWNGPRQDNFDIYVKQMGADLPVRLTKDPADDVSPAWSPDGRTIAFLRGLSDGKNGVFLIPAVGGAERKLTEVFREESFGGGRISWHSNGRWLVIPDKNSPQEPLALFLFSVETGEKRSLTTPPKGLVGDVDPAVSPDGRAVAFTRLISQEDASDLHFLALSEDLRPMGEPKRITFWQKATGEPAWWPDGNSILFASGDSFNSQTLWQMAIRGATRQPGEPERLPFGGEGHRIMPAISRQGRVAYMQHVVIAHIWRMELGGQHREEKMAMNSTRLDHVPQYSPDGKRIAFASDRSGSHEIWVCDADGSNAVKLTSFGGPYVANPAWSPDGRRIAFNARPAGADGTYIVSADGGKPERLSILQSGDGLSSWSRDGKWMYITSDRSGRDQLWKVPVGGGGAVQITKQGGAGGRESPDGKFVYYLLKSGEQEDSTELRRVPTEGGDEVRIVESVCPQYFAVTERGIYFFSSWERSSLQRFNFATRKVEIVAKIEGDLAWGLSVSPDSRWLIFSKYEGAGSNLMLVEKFR